MECVFRRRVDAFPQAITANVENSEMYGCQWLYTNLLSRVASNSKNVGIITIDIPRARLP
jgi:hypothetical protein